jgi:hypothetical protein
MSLSELNKAIDITFKRKDGTEDHWFEKDGILYWHLGKENITLNMGKTKYQDLQDTFPTTPIMFKR